MSDKLIRRRNLESLKKEAKRWFDAIRRNDPEARSRFERVATDAGPKITLRDVQQAMAREHGFAGWTELKHAIENRAPETPGSLARFNEMVDALLDAYHTGTPEAMERHWALTWHRRNHQGMRTYVQLDLGRLQGAPNQNDDITVDDARFLVAREHGFESWDAVLAFCGITESQSSIITAKPIRIADSLSDDDLSTSWASRSWSEVISRLAEGDRTGLDAAGQMTDAMLGDLSRVEQITALRLGGSKGVTDLGIRHLVKLSRLKELDLSGTGITDRGLEVLRGCPELETVSLAWTQFTDAGAVHLSRCERLRSVNLQGTASGDGALRVLAGKKSLCRLRTGNAVTDSGLGLLHDFPVFKRWHGGAPEMALLSYDAGPNYLSIRGPITDQGTKQLEGLDGLFALNLDAAELGISAAALAPLVGLPNLGWLAFDATDDAMPYIARMPRLRFLGCQDTVAGDNGFVAVSHSQSIEYIWGRRCHNLKTRGFSALAQMPALRGLSVSCKNVEESGISLLPKFPALRELMPMDVPDEGYGHIGRCEHLDSLILMYCRETGDRATAHIVGLPRLKSYFASYTRITDRTPELLSKMDSLERITLSGCAGVTNAGLAHLRRLPRLQELRVSGPQITSDVVNAFPSGIRVHYSI
jgi:hypothetical protein